MLLNVTEIEEKLENQPLLSLSEIKQEVSTSASGFYWIYSNLSLDKFKNATDPTNQVHVNFCYLSKIHAELKHVISPIQSDYWCIYNGKGKQLKNRIVAEFTNTAGKTGKLALLRCFKEDDFKIKYIACETTNNIKGIATKYADLERAWRLQFGWPMLCRA